MNSKKYLIVLLSFVILYANSISAFGASEWESFKSKFVSDSGRVIDTGNESISHSEGQGVTMLFATFWDDKAVFDRVWQWTQKNLQVRNDKLCAWKWVPDSNNGGKIADMNNATDGDIMISWALIRAYERWHDVYYSKQAQLIMEDIRKKMILQKGDFLIVLPAEKGFVKNNNIVINLSYWIFPAFQHFQRVFQDQKEWNELISSGMQLLQIARFGRWSLPPNWLLINGKPSLPSDFPPRFGYDAVRIPLYLLWADIKRDDFFKPYKDFWSYFRGGSFLPAWTDLTNDSVDSYDAPNGIHAVKDLVIDGTINTEISLSNDYYSASLSLIAIMAYNEGIIKNKK